MQVGFVEMNSVKARYQALLWEKIEDGRPIPELSCDGQYWHYMQFDCTSEDPAAWDGKLYIDTLQRYINLSGKEIFQDQALQGKILSALDYWLDHDFQNPNWWYNQIGVPTAISNICLMLELILSDSQKNKCVEIISRGVLPGCQTHFQWTGTNLIWGVWTTIRAALITGDSDMLTEALGLASREMKIAPDSLEGIKRDGGFFQHGPQLYSCGYGRSFTTEIATMAYILSGSPYQFSEKSLKNFTSHVLDGQRHLSRGGYFDYNCIGREISRPGATDIASKDQFGFYQSLKRMKNTAEMPRKDEIAAYIASIEDVTQDVMCDVKYFSIVKYLSNKQPGYYIGVRGHDKSLRGGEQLLGENILGYNLCYGSVICIMEDGDEYSKVFPVWDFSMIPGTTAYEESDEMLIGRGEWKHDPGRGISCTGASDGHIGMMHMELVSKGISGELVFVTYESGIAVLAKHLHAENCGKRIRTTLNQCAANMPLCGSTPLEGEAIVESAVSNAGFTYRCLDGGKLTARCITQQGSWRRNNHSESDEPISKEVFTVYIDHGEAIENGSFAYAVEHNESMTSESQIVCVTNTEALSAVEFADGRAAVYFHEPGIYTTSCGKRVSGSGAVIIG